MNPTPLCQVCGIPTQPEEISSVVCNGCISRRMAARNDRHAVVTAAKERQRNIHRMLRWRVDPRIAMVGQMTQARIEAHLA